MSRITLIAILSFSFLVGGYAQPQGQDYTDQLINLTQLTENKQYREAINGYKSLEAQRGTPEWLKAACEYEIAELYGALGETDNSIAALGRAVQLGFDDCITPRMSERLKPILTNAKAAQTLDEMKIAEADFRELVWLKAEVLHARHDGRLMIIENTNRVDHLATEIPQAQLPMRATTSAGVLYWRQQLILRQRMQRAFVLQADTLRLRHVATMAVIQGGSSQLAMAESARKARLAAESRRAEITRRAFRPITRSSDSPKPCSEWK